MISAVGLGARVEWGRRWAPWTSESMAAAGERRAASSSGAVPGGGPRRHRGAGVIACVSDATDLGEEAEDAERIRRGGYAGGNGAFPSRSSRRRRVSRGPRRVTAAAVALAILLACRTGEADNPGPPRVADYADGPAPLADASWKRVLDYPTPHKDGFRDIATAGFEAEAVSPGRRDQEEEFRLVVEVVNSTGWGPLKRRLLSTSSHLVLAQETWVLQDQVAGASTWARKLGWDTIWAPAAIGDGGGASAGVAIFARTGLGLRYPQVGPHILEEARLVAGMVEPPGHRPFLVTSAYLRDGKGMGDENKRSLARIARCIAEQEDGLLHLTGGDFQCNPSSVASSGFPSQVNGRVLAAATRRGTYRTKAAASNIDFFVVADPLAQVIDTVATAEGSGVKGHVPVLATFQPRPVALKALAIRRPPDLPLERVYGPVPPPQNWEEVTAAANAAVEAVTSRAAAKEVQGRLDEAYDAWCRRAEAEVADATGSEPRKRGLRGKRPKLVWASVLPEARARKGQSEEARMTWLRGFTNELTRLGGLMDAEAGGGLFVNHLPEGLNRPHGATFATPVRGGYGVDASAAAGAARGGRPKPSTDLGACEEALKEMVTELRDAQAADGGLGEASTVGGDPEADVAEGSSFAGYAARVMGLAIRTGKAMTSVRDIGFHGDTDLATDVKLLGSALDEEVNKHATRRQAKDGQKWKEWLEDGWASGAKNAHAATRLPVERKLAAVTGEDGELSAAPSAVVGSMRSKYSGYWDAADAPVEYDWGAPCPPLARLSPQEIRSASLSFSRKTAMAYDGWHVRHFSLVSDEGLKALAILYEAIERSSRWPSQVTLVTTPMIDKPRGGHRLVGKLAAAYRVWSKARRPHAEEWEARHDRPFFASAAGCGPVDAVYRQAMRQESAGAAGQAAATVLEDMEAFYETVDRDLLVEEARILGYPTCLIRASLAAYAAPRMITHGRYVSREVHPRRGIIAGCSFATTLVKVFYLRRLDQLSKEIPASVKVDAYIDDLALTAEGPRARVGADLAVAHRALIRALTRDLHCKIARQKTAIVASHRDVGKSIAAALGQEDALASSAVNLGTDVTAGGQRRRLRRGAKRSIRIRNGICRGRRLWAVSKVLGRKALRVFTSGIAPEMSFGGEVWGVSDAEQVKLRRVAAKAMRPRSRCRSLTAVNLMHGLPTASAEIATAVQYSRAVWRAVTRREHAAERGVSLSAIRQQWEASYAGIRDEVANYRADIVRCGGRASPKVARRSWGAVRGPVGAAALTLARAGWEMIDAFTWKDPHGVEIILTKTPPAMVKYMLVQSALDVAEETVGAVWAETDAEFAGRRICPDVAAKLIMSRCGGRLTAQESGAYRAAVCGGIYTRRRAFLGGYDVEDVCEQCGAEGDTIHHRVYLCPHTRAAVLGVVPRWLYEEGGRAPPASKFWTTGIFPHPVQTWPRPEADFRALVVGDDNGSKGLDGWDSAAVGFGGHLYSDGSCAQNPIRGLARAGCSSAQVDDEGRRVRAVYMPVPSSLPQTSQAGEHLGVAISRQMAARAAHVRSDCANVVRAANAPVSKALGPGRMYAGILMDQYARADAASKGTVISWVKAHRAEADTMDAETIRDVRGNAIADALAGEAVSLHPQPTDAQRAELEFRLKRAPLIAKAVGVALAMFPPAEKQRMGRRARPANVDEAKAKQQHFWAFSQGAWRCECCGTWARSDSLTAKQKAERCQGHMAHKQAGTWTSKGHVVAMVEGDAPFAFCSRCGAWGNRRARNLMRQCAGPTPAGSQALRRIASGRHPWRRKLLGGGEAPRAPIKVTTVFDKAATRWRKVSTGGGAPREGSGPGGAEGAVGAAAPPAGGECDHFRLTAHEGVDTYPRAEELPPSPLVDLADQAFGEEDPFGHGGSLSQEDQLAAAAAAPPSAIGGGGDGAGVRNGGGIDCADGTAARQARRARGDGGAEARSRLEAVRRRVLDRVGVSSALSCAAAFNSAAAADCPCEGRPVTSSGHLRVSQSPRADAGHESPAQGSGGSPRSRSRAGSIEDHHRYDRHQVSHRCHGELRPQGAAQDGGERAQRGIGLQRTRYGTTWGASSPCSRVTHRSAAPPPHGRGEGGGGLTGRRHSPTLEYSLTATGSLELQEHPRRAWDLAHVDVRLFPLGACQSAADGDGADEGHVRRGAPGGLPSLGSPDGPASGRGSDVGTASLAGPCVQPAGQGGATRGGECLVKGAEPEAHPSSDVADARRTACVQSGGAEASPRTYRQSVERLGREPRGDGGGRVHRHLGEFAAGAHGQGPRRGAHGRHHDHRGQLRAQPPGRGLRAEDGQELPRHARGDRGARGDADRGVGLPRGGDGVAADGVTTNVGSLGGGQPQSRREFLLALSGGPPMKTHIADSSSTSEARYGAPAVASGGRARDAQTEDSAKQGRGRDDDDRRADDHHARRRRPNPEVHRGEGQRRDRGRPRESRAHGFLCQAAAGHGHRGRRDDGGSGRERVHDEEGLRDRDAHDHGCRDDDGRGDDGGLGHARGPQSVPGGAGGGDEGIAAPSSREQLLRALAAPRKRPRVSSPRRDDEPGGTGARTIDLRDRGSHLRRRDEVGSRGAAAAAAAVVTSEELADAATSSPSGPIGTDSPGDDARAVVGQVLTHHHHPDRAWHPVPGDNRHNYHARHKSSARLLRPSHHEAESGSADAHHIWRGYYGGRDSSPAVPHSPKRAVHGLERSR